MKILTIGNGFIAHHLPYPILEVKIQYNDYSIDRLFEVYKPDVLINCIGKTGVPNVDWCESNKEITATTNTALPILLAEKCSKKSVHLINIGSGCIYFGKSSNIYLGSSRIEHSASDIGWKENDFANPKSFYSRTKYACDLVLEDMPHVTTLRIRMPISEKNHPRNLINKLIGYKQIIDIPNSVTFIKDLQNCVQWCIENNKSGIFHVTNPQPLSAVQIMMEYKKYVPEHTFEVITEQQLDNLTIAKRSNCILNTDKLREAGFEMTPSHDALSYCMAKYILNKNF